uniref:CRAL-TRIO domain-containing protein n=1 Tax=Panagrolaimus sp. JU765 TaxID=591449 RepID=A0AC34PZ40_9BILA
MKSAQKKMKPTKKSNRRRKSQQIKPIMVSEISDLDKHLINELRSRIPTELQLVPDYDDDLSLLRWLVGWDRKIELVVPKISNALKTINAMGLNKKDFSSFESIKEFCDNVSKPACYMPGNLIGRDKEGNVVSLQAMGKIDGPGLLKSTMISDLYVMRIAESEGVMQLIRDMEKKTGKQFGTTVIVDLDGLGMDGLDFTALKCVTGMLGKLQEIFPDVLRKLFIIRAPSFIQLIWAVVHPCLAKQTQQKIEFLGHDWKERLRETIDETILFEHWGGSKESPTPVGDVRMGGKVPRDLYYDPSLDSFASSEHLKKVSIPARSMIFIPIRVHGENSKRKLEWWWKCDSGDVEFGVRLATCGTSTKAEEDSDQLIWPKWRLLTEHVPENRTIPIPSEGLYKLIFDNCHGKLWSKHIKYHYIIHEN